MHHVRPVSVPLPKPRSILVAAVAAVALALPASALAGGFTAHLSAPNHEPKVGNWRITVTANRGGQKLSGTVSYRFLYNHAVVGRQPGGRFSRGVLHDTLVWPKNAVGHTITLQVVVTTRYGTDYLNWWIRVRR